MSAAEPLLRVMAAHGERIALDDGANVWSYRQLLEQIASWRRRLDDLDAQRVAFRLTNGTAWIALDLALLASDRVAVPIPEFFSIAQQEHVLTVSGADTLVIETGGWRPDEFAPVESDDSAVFLTRIRRQAEPPVHGGTAKVTFTSGTTGRPKGVCLGAGHLLCTANAVQSALVEEGIGQHLCALPLSLLLENVAGVYASLGNGSRISVPPLASIGMTGSSALDVHRFVEAQHRYRPESLILVPQLLLALTAAAELGMELPDSYRFVAVGGGRVAGSLLERADGVGIPVYEGYGLTECGSVVAVNLPGARRRGSVGRSLPHVTVGIVDGEIQVIGGAMLGYVGEPAPPPCIATGDLGHLDDDGYLYVDGRRNHGFITAYGRNVSPEWIESELTAEITIAHAVVFGDALPANVALLVPRFAADEDALARAVAAVNSRLPDYARVSRWQRVPADEFAAAGCLTENGRVRRDVVTRRYDEALTDLYTHVETKSDAVVRSTGA